MIAITASAEDRLPADGNLGRETAQTSAVGSQSSVILPANAQLWLTGWTKTIQGGECVSLLVEIADKMEDSPMPMRLSSAPWPLNACVNSASRRRQLHGVLSIRMHLALAHVDALIKRGCLKPEHRGDRDEIAIAIGDLIARTSYRTVTGVS